MKEYILKCKIHKFCVIVNNIHNRDRKKYSNRFNTFIDSFIYQSSIDIRNCLDIDSIRENVIIEKFRTLNKKKYFKIINYYYLIFKKLKTKL